MFKGAFQAQVSPEFTLWTEDQCHILHLATLEILERTGVLVYEEESLKMLKDAGCLVKDKLVKFPPALVEWAIKSAPERCVLATTEGKRTVFLEHNVANYGMGNDLPWFYDSRSKEIRTARISDVEDAAKVADTLEHIAFVGSLALPADVTTQLSDLYNFRAMRQYTKKPILGSTFDVHITRAMIEMGVVSAGGYAEFRRNPNFAVYCEPTSPLVHTREALEKLLLCAAYGVPVTYAPAPMSGGTGPVTMAGTLALGNAECLSGLVIHQLKSKGAPFIMACVAGPLDMQTTVALYADPMVALWQMAVGALGRYYHLPSYGMSGCTDSCVTDLQAALEATHNILAAMWSGTNLIHDNGYMGSGMIGNLEYLVMTNEIIGEVKHFMRGIAINAETLPLDLIDEIGPGGHYLTAEHTMKYFRQETWYPRYMNRKHFLLWAKEDQKNMGQKLNEHVLDVLGQDVRNGISAKELQELDRIIAEQEERVKKSNSNYKGDKVS